MEKKQNNRFPVVRFQANSSLYRIHQDTYNFKTASSNAVKSCTRIEDMQIYDETYIRVFLVLLNNTFVVIFCVKNTTKMTTFKVFLGKNIHKKIPCVCF